MLLGALLVAGCATGRSVKDTVSGWFHRDAAQTPAASNRPAKRKAQTPSPEAPPEPAAEEAAPSAPPETPPEAEPPAPPDEPRKTEPSVFDPY
jgi:hypothetical protein